MSAREVERHMDGVLSTHMADQIDLIVKGQRVKAVHYNMANMSVSVDLEFADWSAPQSGVVNTTIVEEPVK